MEFRDYYETLGVPRTATQADIKKAFRKLARQNHPDVKPGDTEAEARFKAINEANEVLSDPEKRKRYDELGANWDRYGGTGGPGGAPGGDPFGPGGPFSGYGAYGGGTGGSGRGRTSGTGPGGVRYEFHTMDGDEAGFSDFFRMFFGGGMSGGAGGGLGDLDSMGFGRAGGPGGAGGRTGSRAPSGRRGAGSGAGGAGRPHAAKLPPVEAEVEVTLEEVAAGTTRLVEVDGKRLDVTIPRGVDTGSRVRVKGKGGDGRDLVLVIRVPAHRVFTRSGADLTRDLPITLREALLGAEVPVPTLDGRVLLKIPAGTQNGRTIRLKGKGMPILRKDERGDMLARVRVVLPTALSDEAKDAAERFLDLAHQPDPRAV